MKWYIIEDRTTDRGQVFSHPIEAQTKEEAIKAGCFRYGCLTDAEKRGCDDFYVCRAELDEDGCLDYDSIEDVYDIKNGKEM